MTALIIWSVLLVGNWYLHSAWDGIVEREDVSYLIGVFLLAYIALFVAAVAAESRAAYFKVGLRYVATADELNREQLTAALQTAGVPVGEGFRGFAKRSGRRCRIASALTHAADAAATTIVLHHPVLLADEPAIGQLIEAFRRTLVAGKTSS